MRAGRGFDSQSVTELGMSIEKLESNLGGGSSVSSASAPRIRNIGMVNKYLEIFTEVHTVIII